jgi:hypothetical protein
MTDLSAGPSPEEGGVTHHDVRDRLGVKLRGDRRRELLLQRLLFQLSLLLFSSCLSSSPLRSLCPLCAPWLKPVPPV